MTTSAPSLLERLLLAARTALHLSPRQLAYWPLRKIQRRMRPRLAPVEATLSVRALDIVRQRVAAWGCRDESELITRADAVTGGVFTFLNHSETLGTPDWRKRHVSHLWTYNLHYFEFGLDLAWAYHRSGDARHAETFARLATSWMAGCQPGRGDGWDPYVISVRVPNWIYAMSLFGEALPRELRGALAGSIALQSRFLERRLEHHLRANHLQRNYRALFLAGTVLEGSSVHRWKQDGLRGLWTELFEQVLPDGGHFERSPMYHLTALCDFLECLDVARATGEAIPASAEDQLTAMSSAVFVLARPNDDLHLFNDCANGIAPAPSFALQMADVVLTRHPVEPANLALPRTGYYGFADRGAGERILVDAGPPSADYQPGHAHCDLLSFELDLAGRRVIVDSGTSGYEGDPLRTYQRSTRAHNTLVIDGQDQSEIWGTFRLARRARPLHAQTFSDGGRWEFRGAYRPYHSPATMHERSIERVARGHWAISDRVVGGRGQRLEMFLHFHPDFELRRDGDSRVIAACASGPRVEVDIHGADSIQLFRGAEAPALGWYAEQFGRAHPCFTIVATISANDGRELRATLRA